MSVNFLKLQKPRTCCEAEGGGISDQKSMMDAHIGAGSKCFSVMDNSVVSLPPIFICSCTSPAFWTAR
jgi:hypothetical protein